VRGSVQVLGGNVNACPASRARASFPRQHAVHQNPRVPLSIVTQLLAAHRAQDWDRVRSLLHPRGRIGVFAAGGAPTDPEEAIAAMRAAHADLSYSADVSSAHEIDTNVVVLLGSVRHRDADSGRYVESPRAWLYVIEDGLLYRSQMFASEREARETYAAHGRELGIPS
jgi:hypothetical protein